MGSMKHAGVPVLPRSHVRRPDLSRRIGLLPGGSVLLIRAPIGWGASTLLTEVAEESDQPVAWVRCPRHMDRPADFWHRVLSALNTAGVATDGAWEALHGGDRRFLPALLAELAAADPLWLIIDDFDGPAHGALLDDIQRLVDDLPDNVRLALRCENWEGVDLRRLAAAGRAISWGPDELRFDDSRARALISKLDPQLDPDRVTALLGLADGWASALYLPFVSRERTRFDDPAGWLLSSGLPAIAGCVVNGLPAPDQRLLVWSSILDTLDPDICAHLLAAEPADIADQMRRLHRWGVLDSEEQGRYRLHPLLREHSRRTLGDYGARRMQTLHQLACEHLEATGHAEAAATHAFEAGDASRALRLLETSMAQIFEEGRAERVRQIYARSPEPLVTEGNLHILAAAWSELMAGRYSQARRWTDKLQGVVATLPEEPDPRDGEEETGPTWLRAETLHLQAQLASWQGYPERAREYVDRAQQLFGDRWNRMVHQTTAVHAVRTRLWLDDVRGARSRLVSISSRPGTRDYIYSVSLPGLHAYVAAQEGRAHRARHLAQDALAAAEMFPLSRFYDSDARLAASQALLDLDDPATAYTHARVVADRAAESTHLTFRVLGLLAMSRALAGHGEHDEALATCESARTVLRAGAPESHLMATVDRTQLQLLLLAGDRQRALVLARRTAPGPLRDHAETLLTLRKPPRSTPPGSPREAVSMHLQSALVAACSSNSDAPVLLRAGARIAVEYGLLTALRGYPEPLTALAERIAGRPDAQDVAVLVEHLPTTPPIADHHVAEVQLSDGERQLLTLMPTHPGQADLAGALGVSVNTIKTRLRRLYRKLGVSDRAAALERARSEGLVSP